MNVLWIFAHPEQCSLNGALLTEGLEQLRRAGHDYRVSDLYAMGWNPVADAHDVSHDVGDRFIVGAEQERGYRNGTLSADIRAEHAKLALADAVVFQFPMWWLGPPAILKGWFDRVLVQGFAFGVTGADGRTRRYGDGGLAGKRALVITSVGARPSSFGPRGIHGDVEQVLFPLLHGTVFYTGMAVLPPLVVYGADRMDDDGYRAVLPEVRHRLDTLFTAPPLPFRHEDSGNYDDDLVLRPGLSAGQTGLAVHYGARAADTSGAARRNPSRDGGRLPAPS
ncbi:MAG: flavodoxin family protein [Actinophytocola sp.]|nr:flavodoxin family protein [Actinophytocola sp.]